MGFFFSIWKIPFHLFLLLCTNVSFFQSTWFKHFLSLVFRNFTNLPQDVVFFFVYNTHDLLSLLDLNCSIDQIWKHFSVFSFSLALISFASSFETTITHMLEIRSFSLLKVPSVCLLYLPFPCKSLDKYINIILNFFSANPTICVISVSVSIDYFLLILRHTSCSLFV